MHEKYVHENEFEDAIEETRKEERENMAKEMLKENFPDEKILKITQITPQELEKLKK